ncbi:PTS mannose/fructose/sorbose/N-acetylgalactosamine transporter subunit IIC [Mediterraneibacter sp. ICN-202921]|uniref:PTS mannose/fructose/sorbose/N-acetylgalactosamine transporter subunit IIC n=1 Tax=Mediterraneibacter sp. ICN-202921 TaxID=3134657 RepID=UPI0030BC257C
MLISALSVAAVVWFGYTGGYTFPLIMVGRPIIVGPLVGVLLGDFQTGCILGAQLEVMYLGITNVGGTAGTDACTSSAIAVAMAILSGLSNEEAIALAIPIGAIGQIFRGFEPVIGDLLQPIPDKFLEKDNQFMYSVSAFLCHAIMLMPGTIITFIAVMFGGSFVNSVLDSMPQFILDGITAVGSMLPAIGLGMMLSLLWNNKFAIFFILGFFVTKYTGINVLFLSILAVVLATLDYYYTPKKMKNTAEVREENLVMADSGEEGFFDE